MDKTGESPNEVIQVPKQEAHPNLYRGGCWGGGRPSSYKPEYNQQILDYFNREPYEKLPIYHYDKQGKVKSTDYKLIPNKMPTFHEFAAIIGVNEDTLVEWAKEKNEDKYSGFSACYKEAHRLQKWFLINNTLAGLFNPFFAKFLAINITDMEDRTNTDLTSKGDKIDAIREIKEIKYLLPGQDEQPIQSDIVSDEAVG